MYTIVLPVSGGGFVSQLAIIQHLCEAEITPDLTLSSSGGNVAAYIAAAADWKWSGIERVSRELSKDLFISPWTSFSSMSAIVGYFKGEAFNKGIGVSSFLRDFFTEQSITKYEIWTGIYNKTRQKTRLVCNKNESESIIKFSSIDDELTQSMPPIYANGDTSLIAAASMASASIPAIVPPQKLFDEDYVDGGVGSASPLILVKSALIDYVQQNKLPLHLIYINCVDLSSQASKDINNVWDTCKQAANNLIKSQSVFDRLTAYDILKHYSSTINKEEFDCNFENLKSVKQRQKNYKASLLEIFPCERIEVDILKFNGEDAIVEMKKAYKNCKCRFWWV